MPEPTEDALAPVIVRQLHAFPGSSKGELARWWGVQGGATFRKPIASLGDRLTELSADGKKVLVLTEDVETLATIEPSTAVRLLPAFDPYTLGLQKEAEPLLPMARRPLVSRTAGSISQVLIVGGAIQGTWTHEVKTGRLEIRLVPWRRLTKAERTAIDEEAARIGAFLGAEPALSVADPA